MLKFDTIKTKIETMKRKNLSEIEWKEPDEVTGSNAFSAFRIAEENNGLAMYAQLKDDDIYYAICFFEKKNIRSM